MDFHCVYRPLTTEGPMQLAVASCDSIYCSGKVEAYENFRTSLSGRSGVTLVAALQNLFSVSNRPLLWCGLFGFSNGEGLFGFSNGDGIFRLSNEDPLDGVEE